MQTSFSLAYSLFWLVYCSVLKDRSRAPQQSAYLIYHFLPLLSTTFFAFFAFFIYALYYHPLPPPIPPIIKSADETHHLWITRLPLQLYYIYYKNICKSYIFLVFPVCLLCFFCEVGGKYAILSNLFKIKC